MSFNDNGASYGAQIVVGNGGLLQATGTAFNATNGNSTNYSNYTQIVVQSGGHLQASGSSFAVGDVYLADGVVFNAGDLVGDGFDSPLYIPAIDVQYLSGTGSNNLRFEGIYIQPDTIVSGETLALNAIGTQTTTNLRYVFPGGLTVNQGGAVTAAADVPVLFSGGLNCQPGWHRLDRPQRPRDDRSGDEQQHDGVAGRQRHAELRRQRHGELQRQRLLLRRADRGRQRRPAPGHRHRLQRHQRQQHQL